MSLCFCALKTPHFVAHSAVTQTLIVCVVSVGGTLSCHEHLSNSSLLKVIVFYRTAGFVDHTTSCAAGNVMCS